jgi:hypothetical protein
MQAWPTATDKKPVEAERMPPQGFWTITAPELLELGYRRCVYDRPNRPTAQNELWGRLGCPYMTHRRSLVRFTPSRYPHTASTQSDSPATRPESRRLQRFRPLVLAAGEVRQPSETIPPIKSKAPT